MKSDILRKRFGQSRLLNLEALEWLESTMHAKTVRFDIGKGGGTPVSIHAPVWGANVGNETGNVGDSVSIHAPVWGAKREKF